MKLFKFLQPLPYNAEQWKLSFIIIFFAEMITMLAFSSSIVILPFFLQQDLGITSDRDIKIWNGLLAMLPALSMSILAPVWGNLADRYGRKLMLLRAMFLGSLVVLLMALVQNSYQLLALRLIQGAFTGSVAAATALVAGLVPRSSVAFTLGMLQVSIYVGSAFGPAVGGFVFKTLGGRPNFLLTSALLMVCGLVIYKFVPMDPNLATNGALKDQPKKKKQKLKETIKVLAGNKILIYVLVLVLLSQSAFSLTSAIMGVYVQTITPDMSLANAANTAGIVIGVSALASALGAAFFGFLGKKFSFFKLLFICCVGSILTYVPQAFSNSWHHLLYFRLLNSLFIGGVMPAINAMLTLHSQKETQGTVFGFSSSLASMGGVMGPAVGSLIALSLPGINGYRLVFLASAVLLIIITISLILFNKKEQNS